MKVIYVSSLISRQKNNEIMKSSRAKPLQSIQKFHRLICKGIIENGISVEAISAIPISRKISNKIFWVDKSQVEDEIEYNYIPFINIPFFRQLCILLSTFVMIIYKNLKSREKKIYICDILNTTISTVTLILSKIFKFKCIALVTDLPRDMWGVFSISRKINEFLQNRYDSYIILTEKMNEIVNTKNKPYIVIEGISDSNMKEKCNTIENKYKEKVCIYAGGLYERYGVKNLVEAFKLLKQDDIRLHLYGSGDLEEYLAKLDDNRIKYFGVVENEKIVEEEIKATLLINPRFTHEEYTKYSFPSKNMEYMASGTPILTTKLPGMPEEYYDYIYCFEDESIDGMKEQLEKILGLNINDLYEKGKKAKDFVMKEKNNIMQANKIIKVLV